MAERFPVQVAFSTSDNPEGRVSFATLWTQVRRLARWLADHGVERGARVAIRAPNCVEWSLWESAVHAAGGVPVGIGTQWSDEHARKVLADCTPDVIVLESAQALPTLEPALSTRCRFVCLLRGDTAGSSGRATVMPHAEIMRQAESASFEPLCRPEDAATIVYTSGSTGAPKGIMHTHERVMAAVHAIAGLFPELTGGRLALGWMPMEHLFQRNLNLVSIAFGMETRIIANPQDVVLALRDLRPTYFAGVPFVYEQLLHAIESSPDEFEPFRREVRLMIVGAAPTAMDMLQRMHARGYPVVQAYSTSECIVPIASNTLSDNRLGSVGRPHPSYELKISDESEILVRGPGTFSGYVGQEHLAHRLFDADGYFKTGDFGHLDQDRYLYVTGRREDFFKTSTGRRISPFEIESAYKRSPLIEHIVVFGQGRKHPVALVQLEPQRAAALLQALGIPDTDAERWSRDVRVEAAVMKEMREHDRDLDPYKWVRRIAVLPAPLRVETGELTPTLKLRRDVIEQRHRPLLEALRESEES